MLRDFAQMLEICNNRLELVVKKQTLALLSFTVQSVHVWDSWARLQKSSSKFFIDTCDHLLFEQFSTSTCR